ncbi:DUF1566 domain-containing protein [Alistipes sp.]|uniref:Lcl domain-containing protein n=1 Tax=Alistipes sp. TaxID=1872444 RepID=UPI003AEFDD0D
MKKFFFFMAAGMLVMFGGGCSDSEDDNGSAVLAKPVFSNTEATQTTIRVSWNPVANADSYGYEVTGGGLAGVSGTTAERFFALERLTPDAEYLVRVKALSGNGAFRESEYAEVKVSTKPELPRLDKPVPVLPGIVGTSVTVTWEAVAGAASYDYELLKGENTPPLASGSTVECQCVAADLEAGVAHCIRVRAVPTDTERFAPSEWAEIEFTPQALRSYAVGDLYDHGGVKGIVYALDEGSNGTSGMIVSLDETFCVWSPRFDDLSGGENGNGERYDGSVNMERVRQITDWKRYYPGFAWVDEKNVDGVTGWYVPAYSELSKVFEVYNGGPSGRNEEARAAFNAKLVAAGGVAFETVPYWTSTQFDNEMSYAIKFSFGNEALYKSEEHGMRAVHAFPVPENPNPNPGAGIIPFSLSFYEPACDRNASKIELTLSPADAQVNVSETAWCKSSRNGRKIVLTIEANETGSFRSATIDVTLASDAKMKRQIVVTQSQYAIGDFYDVNGVKGVVCNTDGEHGTLISLDETKAIYSREVGETTGADSWSDGLYNFSRISKRDNWQENYPGFAWCNAKNAAGEVKWYLPALNELKQIYDNSTALNQTLNANGGTPLNGSDKYWASNESTSNADFAWYVDFGSWSYEVRDVKEKTTELRVRAVYRY